MFLHTGTLRAVLSRERGPAMRHYFTYHHDENGKTALEIECALVASADLDDVTSEPVVSVERVYVDGPDGVLSIEDADDPILTLLADAIAKAAEADEAFCERVIAGEGFIYAACGPNDPDGHFVRAA